MSQLFGGKPKVDKKAQQAQQAAQRRQDEAINRQTAEEATELGTRRRLAAARAGGRNSLFASTGAAGVQETLG